jgi:hypothetical protein
MVAIHICNLLRKIALRIKGISPERLAWRLTRREGLGWKRLFLLSPPQISAID